MFSRVGGGGEVGGLCVWGRVEGEGGGGGGYLWLETAPV